LPARRHGDSGSSCLFRPARSGSCPGIDRGEAMPDGIRDALELSPAISRGGLPTWLLWASADSCAAGEAPDAFKGALDDLPRGGGGGAPETQPARKLDQGHNHHIAASLCALFPPPLSLSLSLSLSHSLLATSSLVGIRGASALSPEPEGGAGSPTAVLGSGIGGRRADRHGDGGRDGQKRKGERWMERKIAASPFHSSRREGVGGPPALLPPAPRAHKPRVHPFPPCPEGAPKRGKTSARGKGPEPHHPADKAVRTRASARPVAWHLPPRLRPRPAAARFPPPPPLPSPPPPCASLSAPPAPGALASAAPPSPPCLSGLCC